MKTYKIFMPYYYLLFLIIVIICILSLNGIFSLNSIFNFLIIHGVLVVLLITCFSSLFTLKIRGDEYIKNIYPNIFKAYMKDYPEEQVLYARLGTKPIAVLLLIKKYPQDTNILEKEWCLFLKDKYVKSITNDACMSICYVITCIIFIPIMSILSAVIM